MSRGHRVIGIALLVGLGSGSMAAAQEAAPKRFEVAGLAGLWLPQDDADDNADASLGLRGRFAYWVHPIVAVSAMFEWVFVNEDGDGDVTYYGLGVGGLVTLPGPRSIKPIGELAIMRYSVDADAVDAESDIGFRLGGGALFTISPAMDVIAEASYSTVSIDYGIIDVDLSAFVLEAGIAARF